jgi:serine/threonine-protein kinase
LNFKSTERPAELTTEHGQELGNRFLRLPELAAFSAVKRDTRSDLAFAAGIALFAMTGLVPATLLDPDGLMPHQRSDVRAALKTAAGGAFTGLLTFFDRAFRYQPPDRFGTAKEMASALQEVVGSSSVTIEDADSLETLLAARVKSVQSQNLARIREVTSAAMSHIRGIHQNVLGVASGALQSLQTNYAQSNTGIVNSIGFVQPGDQNKRFLPKTQIEVLGDELVIKIGPEQVLRTDANSPTFDSTFSERVRKVFLKGALDLMNE